MALQRDPWSRVTYNGFAKSAAQAEPEPPRPPRDARRRPRAGRTRPRRGLAVVGLASLALLVAALVAGFPTLERLWSGVPLQAALPSALDAPRAAAPPAPVLAAAPAPPPQPAPAPQPITVAALAPPPLEAAAPVAAAPSHRAHAMPPRAERPRPARRRPGISADARERASEATAAANFAATIAPDSTLAGQVAAQPAGPWPPE
jgi:hypothetical protein